jgi:hypothetical protein
MSDMSFMKMTSVAAMAGVASGAATSVAGASPVHHQEPALYGYAQVQYCAPPP